MKEAPILAVIGGTGLYEFDDLIDVETVELDTPFGKPSSPVTIGSLSGKRVAFIARHGLGHVYLPSEVPYRANIYALKSLGVRRILAVSACGSLRDDYAPGHIVLPDQIVDFTKGRARSFFGDGLVAHISAAEPFCGALSDLMYTALVPTGGSVHRGGAFITIEGPRFSTKAESNLFRSWGISIIGMTVSPEAFLAREAEICYTTAAHVTDYDVWHATEETVNVEMIVRTLNENVHLVRQGIRNLVALLDEDFECGCEKSLEKAITTNPARISPEIREKLGLFVDKYLAP